MQQILDLNSESTRIPIEKRIDSIEQLNHDEKEILLYNIITENEEVFSESLGTWKCSPIDIELKDGVIPLW